MARATAEPPVDHDVAQTVRGSPPRGTSPSTRRYAARLAPPSSLKTWLSWRRYYWWMLLTKYGEYELRVLHRHVPRDRVAIDVGANDGVYAYHLSRYARSVVAFEPNPHFNRALRFLPRNVAVRY